MRTVAIISRKGGAGKSTAALHLAVSAAQFGYSTTIFDLDPQASVELWYDNRENKNFPVVKSVKAPLLPAAISKAHDEDVDLLVIDTSSVLDNAASSAADEADLILIPCRPSQMDMSSIDASVRMARSVGKPCVVVLTQAPHQGQELSYSIASIQAAGVEVCPVVLYDRKDYQKGIAAGLTAQEVAPKGRAAQEVRDLLVWVCDRIARQEASQSTAPHYARA